MYKGLLKTVKKETETENFKVKNLLVVSPSDSDWNSHVHWTFPLDIFLSWEKVHQVLISYKYLKYYS